MLLFFYYLFQWSFASKMIKNVKHDKEKNHGEFEELHSIKDEFIFCPYCEKENIPNIPVRKLISTGGKGKVELTGAELKEKHKQDAIAFKKEVYKNERLMANIIGPKYDGKFR